MKFINHVLKTIESSGIPISTAQLALIHRPKSRNGRAVVWSTLRRLERDGLIEKAMVSAQATYWTKKTTEPMPC